MSRSRDSTHYDNLWEAGVNFRERVIYLQGEIDENSLEIVQKALDEFEKQADSPVRIEVNSYGGSVYDMLGIVDRIQSSPCHIITRGFGKVMSAATFIIAAGDERILGANSWFMIHELSDLIKGTLSSMRVDMKHNEVIAKQMYALYEKLAQGKTKAKTFEKLCERDCFLTAEETLKIGLIDKVL